MRMSFRAVSEALRANVKDAAWLVDVFTDAVVYAESDGREGTTGKLFKREYTLDDDGKMELGDRVEVREATEYKPIKYSAAFSGEAKRTEGEFVLRSGTIMEAGDYQDKGWVVDEKVLDYWATTFKDPLPLDLEHMETVLTHEADGVLRGTNPLGELVKVWKEGTRLLGTVRIPKWLDEIFGTEAIKCSVTVGQTGRLIALALTNTPRVENAALAAFARAKETKPTMKTPEEKKKGILAAALAALSAMFTAGNVPEGLKDVTPEEIQAAFTEAPPVISEPPKTDAPSAETIAMTQRIRHLEESVLEERATAFVDKLVTNGRVPPASKEAVKKMYRSAVLDDNAGATTFSAAGADRTKALTEFLEGLRVFPAGEEAVTAFILPSSTAQSTDKPTPERLAELKAMGTLKPEAKKA